MFAPLSLNQVRYTSLGSPQKIMTTVHFYIKMNVIKLITVNKWSTNGQRPDITVKAPRHRSFINFA